MKKLNPWMMNVVVFVVMGLLLMAQGARAQRDVTPADTLALSPAVISYQGTLTDPGGNPVNATVSMQFAIYDAPTDGNLKWGPETHSVQVSDGQFHVNLGSIEGMNPAEDWAASLWLDIEVDGESMTPREQLGSAPFALGASTALNMNMNSITGINDIYSGDAGDGGWGTLNFVMENPYGTIRLRAAQSVVVLLDKDDSGTDAVFKVHTDSENAAIFQVSEDGSIRATGDLSMNGADVLDAGQIGVGTSTPRWDTAVQINSAAVPLTLKETDQTGGGSLWRMPLDGTRLRFDSSDNGVDFSAFHTAISLYKDGSIGCGAITESNLQTEEEKAAGGSDRFEEGDVLCWTGERLEKCAAADDRLVQAVADKSGRPIVIGAEPVKVLGPVRYGDLLVASDVPGYAMVNNDPRVGTVIAQALEDFDGEQGIIKAMIRKF